MQGNGTELLDCGKCYKLGFDDSQLASAFEASVIYFGFSSPCSGLLNPTTDYGRVEEERRIFMPLLLCRDDFARYRIECPPSSRVAQDGDTDFLIVDDPGDPDVPYWLFDELLVEAARSGEFGLRMVSVEPIN